MNYAHKKNIEFVAIVGENELKSGHYTKKHEKWFSRKYQWKSVVESVD